MSFQAYLDHIEDKTGKTPSEFIAREVRPDERVDARGTRR